MPQVWNLGNTTVRNPNRVEEGLQVFASGFQGNVRGEEAEIRFAKRLREEGIVETDRNLAFLARKWRNAFVKLGFVTENKRLVRELADEKPELELKGLEYELTPAGRRLLDADTLGAVRDTFIRQLVRHEIPSPIETGFPEEGQIKPFIFLLQILSKLHEQSQPGLNKTEIAAFIQLFRDHTFEAIESVVEQLLKYREERSQLEGNVAKRNLDNQVLERTADLGGVQAATLKDYADTTFRYTRMSGLLSIHSHNRLTIREEKLDVIKAILNSEPSFLARENPKEYLFEFYKGASLPTDDLVFALAEVARLKTQLKEFEVDVPEEIREHAIENIREAEKVRYRLSELLQWEREERFATEQSNPDTITDIIEYLEDLERGRNYSKEIYDPPSYLEWTIWRALLAIDHVECPIHKTRRFQIDEDMLPRHHAPGGGADMIFEFQDYILVIEVTLTRSSRQIAAEGEPVRRHIADVKRGSDKQVYGLFVAPTIDNNTAETFRIGVWYWGDEEDYLNIIPLTLGQVRRLMCKLRSQTYGPDELRNLFDRCLIYRNFRAPQWKQQIDLETSNWLPNAALLSI